MRRKKGSPRYSPVPQEPLITGPPTLTQFPDTSIATAVALAKIPEELFYEECFRGDLPWVREHLLRHPDLDVNWRKEPHLLTPLYVACQAGHVEVARFLLGLKALDANLPSRTGVTPFSKACTEGHPELVKMMMEFTREKEDSDDNPDDTRPVDVNRPQETGSTPLFMACQNGHTEVVRALLADPRVQINKFRNDNTSPFYKACEKGHVSVVRVLLENAAVNVNAPGMGVTPFYLACEKGDFELVRLLLGDPRVDINAPKDDGSTPLFVTAQNGHLKVAQLLLAYGREISTTVRSRFNDCTASQQGRAMANRVRRPGEHQEDHIRKKTYGPQVADLIDRFERDPHNLRRELLNALPWITEIAVGAVPQQSPPPPLPRFLVRAIHDYTAPAADQLSFGTGDILEVLDRNPTGWWLSEFRGKRGLIPSTYVVEHNSKALPLPPVPVVPQLPAPLFPAPVAELSRPAMVEYDGERTKITIPLTTVEDICATLRRHLAITGEIVVRYKDEDLDEYLPLEDDVRVLPSKPKLRVSIRLGSH